VIATPLVYAAVVTEYVSADGGKGAGGTGVLPPPHPYRKKNIVHTKKKSCRLLGIRISSSIGFGSTSGGGDRGWPNWKAVAYFTPSDGKGAFRFSVKYPTSNSRP
jgi:hypothetical protein